MRILERHFLRSSKLLCGKCIYLATSARQLEIFLTNIWPAHFFFLQMNNKNGNYNWEDFFYVADVGNVACCNVMKTSLSQVKRAFNFFWPQLSRFKSQLIWIETWITCLASKVLYSKMLVLKNNLICGANLKSSLLYWFLNFPAVIHDDWGRYMLVLYGY